MATTSPHKSTKTPPKAKPSKISKSKRALLKKAQDAGGLSNIAVSHTSKEKILKAAREKH